MRIIWYIITLRIEGYNHVKKIQWELRRFEQRPFVGKLEGQVTDEAPSLETSKFSLYFSDCCILSIHSFIIIGTTYTGTDSTPLSRPIFMLEMDNLLGRTVKQRTQIIRLPIDLSPFEWNFDLDKSGQKFHHSLKEHHKISNIPKFRCEML
jgi:hypothetical protein